MSLKVLSAEGSPEIRFPSQSVRRKPQTHKLMKSFVIVLLLILSFVAFVGTMLVHYPQTVDGFLNSDVPEESKHVVTSGK